MVSLHAQLVTVIERVGRTTTMIAPNNDCSLANNNDCSLANLKLFSMSESSARQKKSKPRVMEMRSSSRRLKNATVSFVGDDDVIQHITHISTSHDGKKQNKRKILERAVLKKKRTRIINHEEVVLESSDEELFRPSSALESGDGMMEGEDLFSFQTPKKSGLMAAKALESKTPKSSVQKEVTVMAKKKKTPSKSLKTPVKLRVRWEHRRPETTTPYRLRKRNVPDYQDEFSDDSLDTSSSESEDAEPEVSAAAVTSTQSRNRKREAAVDVPAMVEHYFEVHADKGITTSDHTLSRLKTPRMDQEDLSKLLKDLPASHLDNCKYLYQEYRAKFKKWMFFLKNDFNLLLYGLGSKRMLLEDFRQTMLKDWDHLVVNGFFPSLSIKHILNSITEDIMDCHRVTFKTPMDQIKFIRDHYESGARNIFLVIHNIDGVALRPKKVQSMLSCLSLMRGCHILASIDHINAALVWDQTRYSHFNWLWLNTTTFMPYTEETSYENSLLVQQSGKLALSSLTHILRSLTANAKSIFLLLARYQMDNEENNSYIGMPFQDLYQRCRESFLVNSDVALRSQLTEFKDHKLIRLKKGLDGVEHLSIHMETKILTDFLEQQDEK